MVDGFDQMVFARRPALYQRFGVVLPIGLESFIGLLPIRINGHGLAIYIKRGVVHIPIHQRHGVLAGSH